jgi:hypothetical protein
MRRLAQFALLAGVAALAGVAGWGTSRADAPGPASPPVTPSTRQAIHAVSTEIAPRAPAGTPLPAHAAPAPHTNAKVVGAARGNTLHSPGGTRIGSLHAAAGARGSSGVRAITRPPGATPSLAGQNRPGLAGPHQEAPTGRAQTSAGPGRPALVGINQKALAGRREPPAALPATTAARKNQTTALGGPAQFDPKKNAAIGATLMRPRR